MEAGAKRKRNRGVDSEHVGGANDYFKTKGFTVEEEWHLNLSKSHEWFFAYEDVD